MVSGCVMFDDIEHGPLGRLTGHEDAVNNRPGAGRAASGSAAPDISEAVLL